RRGGGGAGEGDGGVSASVQVATDAAHGPHHILNLVGAGERAPELYRQAEAVDGQHLVESFEDAGGDTGRLLIKPAGEIAQQPKPARGPRVPRDAGGFGGARAPCGG